MKIKVATFNIQSGVSTTKGYWQYIITFWKYFLPHSTQDLSDIATLINLQDIDVISLTEIDGGSLKSNFIDQSLFISEKAQFEYRDFFSAGGILSCTNTGNAILSKHKIISSKKHKLPGRGLERCLGETVIEIDSYKIVFLTTHLSLGKRNRQLQIFEIGAVIGRIEHPVVLFGDFNTDDQTELQSLISERKLIFGSTDKTFPSWNPQLSLDYIFFSKDFKLTYCNIIEKRLSDHLMVIAEATLIL